MLSEAQTPKRGIRALDVLHVASANVLACRRFVTYDERQAELARAVGLRVPSPPETHAPIWHEVLAGQTLLHLAQLAGSFPPFC